MTTFAIVYILALLVCLALFTIDLDNGRRNNMEADPVDIMVCIALSVIPFLNVVVAARLAYVLIKRLK